ncbi:hypothetical protein VINI7043_20831 [Vibrio nigripulchritudo ATCC 27043]|uniref:hypothetical protein n=1 Tax=Vibrio nigripulchritudo TaxID=28173 RepID=UPI00021C3163|nr:hypothetical protein [Vibrio nigripulchritudo]EGU58563.1 hypothetical protein VINI7043_20831 [Vibrio nigripulchritudo ATCC 27043]
MQKVYLTSFNDEGGTNDIIEATRFLKSPCISKIKLVIFENKGGSVSNLIKLEMALESALKRGVRADIVFQDRAASCGAVFYVFCQQLKREFANQVHLQVNGTNGEFYLCFHQTRFNFYDIDINGLDLSGITYDTENRILSIFASNENHPIITQLENRHPEYKQGLQKLFQNNENKLFFKRFKQAILRLKFVEDKSVSYYFNQYQQNLDVVLKVVVEQV